MDRVAPTVRPHMPVVGWQNWRELLFLHWEVDADRLAQTLPPGLILDTFQGRAFVGIVPFRMCGIRPRWLPNRFAINFLETNLRTYVICQDEPGVYFYSLDANSRLAVLAARVGWSLPYFHASMQSTSRAGEVRYRSRRRQGEAHLDVCYRIGASLGPSMPGTLEHFLLERYLLFTIRGGGILRGQVHHLPYPADGAELLEVAQTLGDSSVLPRLSGWPVSAHYSPGVDVEIFPLRKAIDG